jgi:hypothetical protein
MNLSEELNDAVQAAASNPKVLAAVSGTTTALGAASITEVVGGLLSYSAMCAGIVATILLGRVHWATYKRQILEAKLLKKQLHDLGVDPDADE